MRVPTDIRRTPQHQTMQGSSRESSDLCKLSLTTPPPSGDKWFAFAVLVCMGPRGLHALPWSACAAMLCMDSLDCMRLTGLNASPRSAEPDVQTATVPNYPITKLSYVCSGIVLQRTEMCIPRVLDALVDRSRGDLIKNVKRMRKGEERTRCPRARGSAPGATPRAARRARPTGAQAC